MTERIEYGESFFSSKSFKRYVKYYTKVLPDDVNCLVSMGSSGCSIASAMLLVSKYPLKHIYLKKNNEKSHNAFSGPNICYNDVVAIVDDFISTGATIRKIHKKLDRLFGDKAKVKYIIIGNQYCCDYKPKRGEKLIFAC